MLLIYILAALFMFNFGGVNISETSDADYGFDGLEWGMSVEEASEYIPLEKSSEEIVETDYGQVQTLHVYEDVMLMDYKAELTLCYVDGFENDSGFNGYNYRISGNVDVYNNLHDDFTEKYGAAEEGYDYATWYPQGEDYYIFLMAYDENGSTITQCSFYPVE